MKKKAGEVNGMMKEDIAQRRASGGEPFLSVLSSHEEESAFCSSTIRERVKCRRGQESSKKKTVLADYLSESRQDITSIFLRKVDEMRDSACQGLDVNKNVEDLSKSDIHHRPDHPIYRQVHFLSRKSLAARRC